mgnify:CR=1 FL=1|tara:strand:+ start:259 stop:1137 length:879 start_codon:yes stop_codon:yes gene_type:complete
MDIRRFGNTGLQVSALGYGAGQIGDESIDEKHVEYMLNHAADLGITLFDTARGYGASEERIGKYLNHRRHDIVISTKIGYGIDGTLDWTPECIRRGIEEALQRLQTDYIDIVHLHSCPTDTLKQQDLIDTLLEAVGEGKVRVAAYAGENEPLYHALHQGVFRSLMMSVNICDQRFLTDGLWTAKEKGLGIIAKRPVANAPWRFDNQPHGDYCEPYWVRWKTMALEFGMDWQELALRFTAYTYGIDSCIVGTTNPEHLEANIRYCEQGPLHDDIVEQLRQRFQECDDGWVGQL